MSTEFHKNLARYLQATEGKPHGNVMFEHRYPMMMEFGPGVMGVIDVDEISVYFDSDQWEIKKREPEEKYSLALENIPEAQGLALLISPISFVNFRETHRLAQKRLRAKAGAKFFEEPKLWSISKEFKTLLSLLTITHVFGQKIIY